MSWCAQMLLGLIYLHQKEVIHRDLKVDNVLRPDVSDRVKLCDFGISRVTESEKSMNKVGTPRNLAPEQEDRPSGLEIDLWSLGMVLYKLATLRHPFELPCVEGCSDSDAVRAMRV